MSQPNTTSPETDEGGPMRTHALTLIPARFLFAIATATVVLISLIAASGDASAAGSPGAAYTISNDAAGNAVLVLERASDGTLSPAATFDTGGLGSGGGLGSQGAVVLSQNNQLLFVVNAGSNEISALRVNPHGLSLLGTVDSGGIQPISLTVHGDLLYVLNAGGDGSITAFNVSAEGELTQVAGSTRALSSNAAGPAQVQFSPDGQFLVVTEKATNKISTYTVGEDGLATGPNVQQSAGATPFGFDFDNKGHLIVSEAFGGAPNASAVSSYSLSGGGDLSVITASAGDTESAACWIVVTKDGRFAYTTNTGSGSVSGYRIAADGRLALLDADGVTGVTGLGTA